MDADTDTGTDTDTDADTDTDTDNSLPGQLMYTPTHPSETSYPEETDQ